MPDGAPTGGGTPRRPEPGVGGDRIRAQNGRGPDPEVAVDHPPLDQGRGKRRPPLDEEGLDPLIHAEMPEDLAEIVPRVDDRPGTGDREELEVGGEGLVAGKDDA